MRVRLLLQVGFILAAQVTTAEISNAEAICLRKDIGQRSIARVIAPKREVGRYRALGYEIEECGLSSEEIKRAVRNICEIAQTAPAEIQEQFMQLRGVSFAQLCSSGRAAIQEMEDTREL